MNRQRKMIRGIGTAAGVLVLGLLPLYSVHAETEEVRVIDRKPDETNPLYEIVETEGGFFFRAPKDMSFVKRDGVTAPISTEEYCLKKFEAVEMQIEMLNKRIDALERRPGIAPGRKDQASL